jgi:hypothetical protein
MNPGIIVLVIVASAIVGAGIAYWLMRQQLERQQQEQAEQMRQRLESLEREHESRLQAAIEPIQQRYEGELQQTRQRLEELEKQRDSQGQTSAEYEQQLQQTRDRISQLEQQHHSQRQTIESLQAERSTSPPSDEAKPADAPTEDKPRATPAPEPASTPMEVRTFQKPNSFGDTVLPAQLAACEPVKQMLQALEHPKDEDLGRKMIFWGDSGNPIYIPTLLGHARHRESAIRATVALAVGQIAATMSVRSEIQRAIPVLGNLSQDPDPRVRQAAVEALGQIKSEKVIPFLRQSVRDSDRAIVKIASEALQKFKFYPQTGPKTKPVQPKTSKPNEKKQAQS